MSKAEGLHEQLDRPDEVVGPSNRKFGVSFAVIFALFGAYTLWRGSPLSVWWFCAGALCLAIALLRPKLLQPLNRAWTGLGLLLFKVVNPLVMALLFYLTILPIGLLMRSMGKDLLRLRLDPSAPTYWIRRDPPGPAPETMKQQF